jgi:hypothetical protein
MGPALPPERAAVMGQSPVRGHYDEVKDRESAFEMLQAKAQQAAAAAAREEEAEAAEKAAARASAPRSRTPDYDDGYARPRRAPARRASTRQGAGEAFFKSMLRTAGSTLGRELLRGVLGSLKKR